MSDNGMVIDPESENAKSKWGGDSCLVVFPDGTTMLIDSGMYQYADVNNSSMVLRMDYGEFSALFTGDIYAAKEAQLVAAYSDVLDVDLLKIPHHGYSTSNTTAFANATSPVVAVATGYVQMPVSICNNYRKSGAQVLFDYVDGYIHVWSDVMQNIGWETSKERTGLFQERYGRAEFIPKMEWGFRMVWIYFCAVCIFLQKPN